MVWILTGDVVEIGPHRSCTLGSSHGDLRLVQSIRMDNANGLVHLGGELFMSKARRCERLRTLSQVAGPSGCHDQALQLVEGMFGIAPEAVVGTFEFTHDAAHEEQILYSHVGPQFL